MNDFKENILVQYAKHRVDNNKNFIICFLGETGSGKSWAALDYAIKTAVKCGSNFTIKDNVAFSFADMLKKIDIKENQNAGTCFLMEEIGSVGSGGSSHEWGTKANAFFSSFVQTSRHRRQILIFTVPNWSLIMKQVRMLIHAQAEMLFINPKNNTSRAKVFLSQTNRRSGKIYFKYMRVVSNGERLRIDYFTFNKPPKDIVDEYEIEKRKFTDKLNAEILKKLSGEDKSSYRNSINDTDRFKELYYTLTLKELANIFKVSVGTCINKAKSLGLQKTIQRNRGKSSKNLGFDSINTAKGSI